MHSANGHQTKSLLSSTTPCRTWALAALLAGAATTFLVLVLQSPDPDKLLPGTKKSRDNQPRGLTDLRHPRPSTAGSSGAPSREPNTSGTPPKTMPAAPFSSHQTIDPNHLIREWLSDLPKFLRALLRVRTLAERHARDVRILTLLGFLGRDPEARASLFGSLHLMNGEERHALITIIGRLSTPDARTLLEGLLRDTSHPLEVRLSALQSLAQGGQMEDPPPKTPQETICSTSTGDGSAATSTVEALLAVLGEEGFLELKKAAAAFLGHVLLDAHEQRLLIGAGGEPGPLGKQTRTIITQLESVLLAAPTGSPVEAGVIGALAHGQVDGRCLNDSAAVSSRLAEVIRRDSGNRDDILALRMVAIQAYQRTAKEPNREIVRLAEAPEGKAILHTLIAHIQPDTDSRPALERIVRRHLLGNNYDPRNRLLNDSCLYAISKFGMDSLPLLDDIAQRGRDESLRRRAQEERRRVVERETSRNKGEEWLRRFKERGSLHDR